MANGYIVPGPCTITFGGSNFGQSREGMLIDLQTFLEPIYSDKYGRTPIDQIFAGKALTISMLSIEPTLVKSKWISAFASVGTADIGKLASALTNAAVLTIVDTASTAGTWTTYKSVLNAPSRLQLQSTAELRVPLVWTCIPDPDTGKFFTAVPSYLA